MQLTRERQVRPEGYDSGRQELAALPIRSGVSIKQWVTYVLAIYVALFLVHFFVFNENWDWEMICSYLFSQIVMEGLLHTIVLTILTTILGLILGVITAWCRMSDFPVLRTFAILYIWIMRAYMKVLGPQLIRSITPALANEVITIFKSTSLVSVIGYTELLTTVQTIYAVNFKTIPLLTVAVIWYLVLTSLAMVGQSMLERRFGRGFTRRRGPVPKTTAKVVDPSTLGRIE